MIGTTRKLRELHEASKLKFIKYTKRKSRILRYQKVINHDYSTQQEAAKSEKRRFQYKQELISEFDDQHLLGANGRFVKVAGPWIVI